VALATKSHTQKTPQKLSLSITLAQTVHLALNNFTCCSILYYYQTIRFK